MRFILIALFLSSIVIAEELTIKYEIQPELFISGDDFTSLVIKPDGSAIRIGDLPSPIKDNEFDWEEFHKESENHIHEVQYSPEQYREVLKQVLEIVSEVKPTNESLGGKGFTTFNISLWGNPNVEFRFNSIGGKDYPERVNKLSQYIQALSPPNQSSKPDAESAGS